MTPLSISALTGSQQMADAKAHATPEQQKVARDFEAIFLRKLLSSMEKTGGIGGSGSGAQVYRSMMVGALADSAAESGGIGLSDMILEAMLRSEGVGAARATSAGLAQTANEVSQGGAPVALDRGALDDSTVKKLSSPLTPVGDATTGLGSLKLLPGNEKDEASRGAPKGGGR